MLVIVCQGNEEEYKEHGEIVETKSIVKENDGTWGYSLAPEHMKPDKPLHLLLSHPLHDGHPDKYSLQASDG